MKKNFQIEPLFKVLFGHNIALANFVSFGEMFFLFCYLDYKRVAFNKLLSCSYDGSMLDAALAFYEFKVRAVLFDH